MNRQKTVLNRQCSKEIHANIVHISLEPVAVIPIIHCDKPYSGKWKYLLQICAFSPFYTPSRFLQTKRVSNTAVSTLFSHLYCLYYGIFYTLQVILQPYSI